MRDMAVTVNIHEAKTHLSKLLERVAAGESVIIAKAGVPVADLVPHRSKRVRIGGLKGEISFPDDFGEVDEEMLAMFYGQDDSATPASDAAS